MAGSTPPDPLPNIAASRSRRAQIARRDFGTKLAPGGRARAASALREIANRTVISTAVLEALERRVDAARLPGGSFSRAFVRSFYAREARSRSDATVEEFTGLLPRGSRWRPRTDESDQVEDAQTLSRAIAGSPACARILLTGARALAGGVLYLGMHQTGTS